MEKFNNNSNLVPEKIQKEFLQEYIDESGFKQFMSKSGKNVIHVYSENITGDTMTIPLVFANRSKGVGTGRLVGNKYQRKQVDYIARLNWVKNTQIFPKSSSNISVIDLYKACKETLKDWAIERFYHDMIEALCSIGKKESNYDGQNGFSWNNPIYLAKKEEINKWFSDNKQDRIVMGNNDSNKMDDCFFTNLSKLGTKDNINANFLNKLKRTARARSFLGDASDTRSAIHPIRVAGMREYFVVFVDSHAFSTLQEDPLIRDIRDNYFYTANKDMQENSLFQDGDIIYDGMVIREIQGLPTLNFKKQPSLNNKRFSMVHLCGRQALVNAIGQKIKITTHSKYDHGFLSDVGTEEFRTVEKIFFHDPETEKLKQFGTVTGFVPILR